jgi:type IV secretory pathway VirB4 component
MLKLISQPKNSSFLSAEPNIIDSFSYNGLKENSDHLICDNQFLRILYISGYPFVASSGWLDHLTNFNHDSDITYHWHEVDSQMALPKLNRKITELESIKRTIIKDGKILGSEITDPLDSALNLREQILRGEQKLFQIGIYICLRAATYDLLNKHTKMLEASLASRLFYTKIAQYEQLKALNSVLPRAEDQLQKLRNLNSSSLALTFPFMSSEFVSPKGILYGINKTNSSLVIVDRFSLNNANSIIFAQSGSGKSYLTKVEILRQIANGTKVIVIDPESEYGRVTESLNGIRINLSLTSKEHINPFDLICLPLKSKDISFQVQNLTSLITILAEGLNNQEKSIVDKAILKLYKNKSKVQPLLKDLYKLILDFHLDQLAARLEKYVNGSMKNLFNHQTNIQLQNRLIVFDIKNLNDNIRPAMMMIIANFVSTHVQEIKSKKLLIIDEGWLLLEHQASARFIAGLVRRARKYYLGVSIISQQANDFLKNSYGRVIASQSNFRILMRQDSTTINGVSKEFKLSEYETNYLMTAERGDCLMLIDQNHVAVKVVSSPKEHPLITTDPNELYLG